MRIVVFGFWMKNTLGRDALCLVTVVFLLFWLVLTPWFRPQPEIISTWWSNLDKGDPMRVKPESGLRMAD